MGDFKKLEVWQDAHKLTIEIYKITKKLPLGERFGLSTQLRRAAVSVESNIAEGESRFSNKEKIKFFTISRGSIAEVCTQLLIVGDIYKNLVELSKDIYSNYEILGKKLTNLIKYRRINTNPQTN